MFNHIVSVMSKGMYQEFMDVPDAKSKGAVFIAVLDENHKMIGVIPLNKIKDE